MPKKHVWLGLCAAGCVLALVVALFVWQRGGTGKLPASKPDGATIALGAQVYAEQCASCHGANLEGEENWRTPLPGGGYPAPPHDETGHTWHHPDQLLFDYTKKGGHALAGDAIKSNMPGFGDQLSDAEIRAVIAFIKSRWPPEIRKKQERATRLSASGGE